MLKANSFISTFIHLFVKSAPAHPKPRNVSPFKVIGSFTLKNSKKHKVKNYGWHLLVMVITHTLQHRPKCPLISHLKNYPTSPNGKSALYLRAFRCVFHTRKKWNRNIPSTISNVQYVRSACIFPMLFQKSSWKLTQISAEYPAKHCATCNVYLWPNRF